MENLEKVEEKVEEKVIKSDKVEVKDAGIDADVLAEFTKANVLESISDQKQMNRVILNCMCETLSEVKHLTQAVDDFLNVLTICSSDKLADFFTKLKTNVKHEQVVQNVKKKIAQSHQKSKKTTNVVKFPNKDVK